MMLLFFFFFTEKKKFFKQSYIASETSALYHTRNEGRLTEMSWGFLEAIWKYGISEIAQLSERQHATLGCVSWAVQDKKVESHHLLLLGSFSEGLSLESPLWDTKRGSHLGLDAHDTWKAPAQVGLADNVWIFLLSQGLKWQQQQRHNLHHAPVVCVKLAVDCCSDLLLQYSYNLSLRSLCHP